MLQGYTSLLVFCITVGLPFIVQSAVKEDGVENGRNNGKGRVVNGEIAAEGQFPFQVSLRHGGRHFCGGSLISPRHVLTVAHCVERASPASISVVVGSNKLNYGGSLHRVNKITVHEDWDSETGENDIAVIELSSDVGRGPNIDFVTLPLSEPTDGTECTVIGWGSTFYPDGITPNDLQYLDTTTINLEQCQASYMAQEYGYIVFDTNICTLTKAGEGACHGDSGGALVLKSYVSPNRPIYTQVGLVSWGKSCAVGYPDVFTSVARFNAWINAAML